MDLKAYNLAFLSLSSMGLLVLVQHFLAAVGKNVLTKGTTPGVPLAQGHDNAGFRLERAHANTLENLLPFFLVTLLAVFLGVSPWWTNTLAVVFLGARVLHMIVYYANIQPVRTLAFLVGYLSMTILSVMTVIRTFHLF